MLKHHAYRYLREDVSLDELFQNEHVILFSVENSEQDVEKTLNLFDHYKPRRPTRENPHTYQVKRHGAFEDRETPHRDWSKETLFNDALVFILVDYSEFEWEKFFKVDPRDESAAWGDYPDDLRIQDGVIFYVKGKVFGIGSRYQHLQHDGIVLDMAEIDLNGHIVQYHIRPGANNTWQIALGGNDEPMEFNEIYPQICLFDHERKHLESEK